LIIPQKAHFGVYGLILVTGVETYCGDEAYGFVEATEPCWGRGSLKIPRF